MKTIAKLILLSFLMGGSVAFGADVNNPTIGQLDSNQTSAKATPCPEDRVGGEGEGTNGEPAVAPSGNGAEGA